MIDDEYIKFASNIRKLNSNRSHKIKNSYGIYDGYKYYRKNKPKDKKYIISESQYFSIHRMINNIIAEQLSLGVEFKLPHKMGTLEVRKYNSTITFSEGKLKTNLPIDWDKTIKLWYEDECSYKNKTLIRVESKELFKVHYNKCRANYKNKLFYKFSINREIKKKLKHNIKEDKIDAFLI